MQLFGDTAIQHLSSLALRCLVKNAGTQVCPHLSSVLERKLPVIVFNLDEPGVRAWISRSGTARIVLTGRCAATAVAAGLVAQLAVGIRLVDLIVEDMVTGKEGHIPDCGTDLAVVAAFEEGKLSGHHDIVLVGQIGVSHELIQPHGVPVHVDRHIELAVEQLSSDVVQDFLECQIIAVQIDAAGRISLFRLPVIRDDDQRTLDLLVGLIIAGFSLHQRERLLIAFPGERQTAAEGSVQMQVPILVLIGTRDADTIAERVGHDNLLSVPRRTLQSTLVNN